MLETLFGNPTANRLLLYMHNYEQGYAAAIARTYSIPVSQVQKQLERFERGNVLVSQKQGPIRLYSWNPRYSFQKQLRALLEEAFQHMSDAEVKKYYRQRRRPRRKGKPL